MSRNAGQTYRYIKDDSIVYDKTDDYQLTVDEYYKLYNFFVTNSMAGSQSLKKKSFEDYGWSSDNLDAERSNGESTICLATELAQIINCQRNCNFIYTEENNLRQLFARLGLIDGSLQNILDERFVIAKTQGNNIYLKLFYRLRNCLAHGKFILKTSPDNEKMIILQDDDQHNVTARIVLKLATLINLINAITADN